MWNPSKPIGRGSARVQQKGAECSFLAIGGLNWCGWCPICPQEPGFKSPNQATIWGLPDRQLKAAPICSLIQPAYALKVYTVPKSRDHLPGKKQSTNLLDFKRRAPSKRQAALQPNLNPFALKTCVSSTAKGYQHLGMCQNYTTRPHFRTYFSGWIGMFTGGTGFWVLTTTAIWAWRVQRDLEIEIAGSWRRTFSRTASFGSWRRQSEPIDVRAGVHLPGNLQKTHFLGGPPVLTHTNSVSLAQNRFG